MLEVKNLHARIGEKEILKGIDLVINDGETHAIMGPNGSGKSTLSAVLVGNPLYEVTEGEAYFNGNNLVEMKPEDVDISEAEIIVQCGRGVKSKADLAMVEEFADLIGARMACTRPLVENNWFDAKHQIGLSGRTVKPKLLVCVGVSGAVQTVAGMKGSELIVAINSDPEAPIFDVAHYGFVGDLYEIIPALISQIRRRQEDAR